MAPSRGIFRRINLASALVATLVLLVQLLDVTTVAASFQLQKPSKIYDAAYHAPNRKDRVRTDKLPSRVDAGHFSSGALFGNGRSDVKLSHSFKFLPFFGPSSGKTPVEIEVTGVFPSGVDSAYCHFGSKTTAVKVARAKRHSSKLQTIKFTCYSPVGKPGKSIAVSVSVNDVTYYDAAQASSRFYYYSEPRILDISPAISDLQGGTLVTVYPSHDIFSQAFGSKRDEFFKDKALGKASLSNIQCTFDGIRSVGLRKRKCYERSCFVCISPAVQDVGKVEVTVAPNGINRLQDRTHFTYTDLNYAPGTVVVGTNRISSVQYGELQSKLLYGEDPGVFYELTYPGSKYVPQEFYDTNMYEFYQTSLERHEAQFCLSKITTNLGPVSGGTVVTLGGRGSISKGKEDFYCVFGNTFVQASSVTYSFSDEMYLLECTTPSDTVGGVAARVSLDGVEAASSGLTFTYHNELDVSSITPSSVPSVGGTSVEITLKNDMSGISSRSCVCRFQVSLTQVLETTASYDEATKKVTCTAPGVTTDLDETAVEVSVSFNGKDFGPPSNLFTTGKTAAGYEDRFDFYGLLDGLIPIAALELVQTVTPSLSISESASYGEDMCVHFTMNSIAVLSGLELFGITQMPDLQEEVLSASFEPSFQMDLYEYSAVVNYEVHSIACRGVGADTYSNIFVENSIVPSLGVSDSIPLVTGMNKIEIAIFSSNGLYSNTYTLQIERLPQRTTKSLSMITVNDAEGSTYTLNPSFQSGVLSYSLAEAVPYHLSSVAVTITHGDTYGIVKASVAADKSDEVTIGDSAALHTADMNLQVGSNTMSLESFAQDRGISQTYSITASRLSASTDSTFSKVELKNGGGEVYSLTPAFSQETTTYDASIRYTDTFTISLTTANQKATFKGPDGVVHTHTGTYSASIPVGVTVLTFELTAQDLTTTRTYTINLTREVASADARLGSIETKACSSITQANVEPAFSSDIDTYTAPVYFECSPSLESDPMGAQYISVNATCLDKKCSGIRIYEPKGDRWITATPGQYTTLELNGNPLSDITNAILLEVTAEDDIISVSTKKTYTLNAVRQKKDNNANLLSLVVNNAATSGFPTSGVLHRNTGEDVLPAFDKTHHEYWMEVENSVASLTVTASVASGFAILKVGILSPASLSTVSNGTESQALSLTAGQTTTITVEVLSQRYQPNESVEGYDASTSTAGTDGTGSRIINYIHVFRRTKSTDATLSGLVVNTVGPADGVVTAFNPTFASATTAYSMTVRYYIGTLNITGTCPDTASPVSYKNHTSRCSVKVDTVSASSGGVLQKTLVAGTNAVNVVVTAEDGTTTKTYTITVTKQVPQTDSSLKSLGLTCGSLPSKMPPAYQTDLDSSITASCWLSKTATGGDPSVAGYDSAFAASHLVYYVRAQHSYLYHGAVVSPDLTFISFTPKVNSTVDSVPVATMTLNGVTISDSVASASQVLLEAPSSQFPTPKTTTFSLEVTAEDGSKTTYTIHVVKAAVEPAASEWVKYYELNTYSNKTSTSIVAGTDTIFSLDINKSKWNSDIGSTLSSLTDVFTPISAMVFEPIVKLNTTIDVAAANASLSVGGRCSTGYSCINYYCSANGTASSTVCDKSVPYTLVPELVGDYEFKVQAYSQFVNLVGSQSVASTFHVIHAKMSLNKTKIVYPTDGLVGYVSQPGPENVLLQAYDIYGNIILDTRLTYTSDQIEALLCPPDFIPQNSSYDPTAPAPPGYEGYCRCGPATGCSVPQRATISQNNNGTYTLQMSTLTTGINNIYMSADYSGLPLNGGPGSDYFGTYPVPISVSTNPIGIRSTLVFNSSAESFVGNSTQNPYFHVSAYDQYSNKISTGGDMSTISLSFDPPLTYGFVLTDEGLGMYKVVVSTEVAAKYKVNLYINNAISVGSPFTFQVFAGNFSDKSFADFPAQSYAGVKKQFYVHPRDSFGNAIEYNSPHGSVADRLTLEVTSLTTSSKEITEQTFTLQPDGTYLCNFTAPTNATQSYGQKVFFLDKSKSQNLFEVVAKVSSVLDILGSYPNPAKSTYFAADNQKAGNVILGIVGIDDYGNRSPHFWSKWSASLTLQNGVAASYIGPGSAGGPITAKATADLYQTTGGSVQIAFSTAVNISGDYLVQYYYDDTLVTGLGSDYSISVEPADIGMFSNISSIPSTTALGQLVTVDVDSYDTFGNKISTGNQTDLVNIKIYKQVDQTDVVDYEIADNGDGTFQVKFSPKRSGVYVFEVIYNSDGKSASQTFDVKFEFALPEHFEAILPQTFAAGVESTIVIQPIEGVDLGAAAKSVIIAQLRSTDTSLSPVNLTVSTPDSDGRRTLSVLKTISGNYFLDIFLEGKHAGSSPYSIPILPGPISTTNVDDLNQTTFYSDDVIEVTLQLFDQYNNSAQVDIENDISVKYYQKPEGLIVEADVTQTASGYTASVKLTLAAEYQIQIIVKGTQLCIEGRQDCTPTVTVLPGNVNALTSLLEGNGLGKTIVAGIEGNVRVVPLDSYSNLAQESKSQLMEYTLNIFAAGNSTQVGSPIKLTFSALDVSHSASYTLNEAGKYQMQVVQQDNAIVTGKLIDVEVVPSDAVVANTQIDPIVSNVAVGSFGRINFSLKDQFQNVIMTDLGKDVGLMLTNPSKVLSSEANDVSLVFLDGTYNATFSTTVAGTYSVSVQVFGVGITSNDTIRFVPGMPFASTSIARLAGNGLGTAGQKNVLYIDGKDKYGNARTELGGSYTVDVSVPHGTSTKKLPSSDISMTWNTEGAVPFYQVEFVCEPKGVAFVEVKIDGEQVVGSPLSINVSPSTIDPQRCILSGPGTTGGILNQETFFEIQSMDSYGNERTVGGDKFEVSVKCTTSPCPAVDVDVKDQNTGKYDVRYTLKSLGTFTLEVRLGLEDVGLLPVRSPLVVSSKNTAGLINLFVSQVFGIPSSVSAGVKQTITVIALDSEGFQLTTGGETLVASIAPIGLSSSKLEFPSIDLQNGTYSIDFELVSAGPYQLDLHHISSIGAKTLVGSNSLSYPVSVECLPGISTVEKSKIIQPGIPTTVPAGEFHSVFVQAIDIYGNTQVFKDGVEDVWTIEGSPVNSSVALQVASTRKKVSLSEGLYELAFKLPDIGLYQLDILLQNTSGSYPFASAVVEGIPGGLDASQVYTLDTSNLETGAGNATEISFKPRDVSGNIIPSLSSIPTCSVDVSPVDENAFNYTNVQEIVPVMTCVYTKDTNTFVASFMSLKSGKFSLSVKLDSAHILGSPFEANIHPASPSYAKTEGIDFTGVEVNEKLAPLVTLFDQYNNTVLDGSAEITVQAIQAQAEGLRESYSSFVENYGNGTYKASLQVQIADTFNFVVITGGKTLLNRTLQVDPLQTSAIQSFINPNSYFDGASFTVSAGTVVESTIVAIAEDGNKQQGGKDVFSVSMSPDSVYLASVIDSTALSGTVDGEYSFRFMTKRALADGYLLSLTLGGSHVKGSPYPVRVSPGKASASQSNIYSGNYGYDSSLGEFGSVAGVGRKFLLQLRDEYGNDLDQETSSSSGNKLSVKIDGATNVTTSIAGMPDGRFEMFYSVNLANTYYLQAQLEGVNVGGGSSITVVAGENDFSQFHVYGPGITEEVIVGYTYHFNIEARDKYGNTRQDDGSTLPFLQVDMVSKVLDRKTSSTTDHKFDLVQIKYESSGSSAGSQEQWKAGSFRVMFKTTTSGQIHTTISGCSVAGSTCSHLESDLEKYNVEAQGVASSPYSTQKAKPQSMTASTLSGVGLQGGVLASGATKTEALPIVIEPRDKYGNILELGNDFASLLAVSITPSLGITSTGIVTLDDKSGFAFNLTATAIGDYYLDVKYNGTSLISNPVKIPVYTSYPPIDPAQCIDYGDIFEFCVVGQTCKSSIQLYTEAKDPTCWTDQSTGKLMVSSALRYAEKVQRPTECQGIFYPFSKDSGGESYVTVLADSTKVNDIIFGGDGTYTASMGFSISGLHTIEAKVGPDTESRWIQTVTVAVADGKTKVIKVFSSNTTDLTVSSYPTLALTGQEIKVVIQPKDKFGNKQDYVAAIEDDFEVNYTSNTFLEYSSTLAKKRSTTSSIPFFYHEASYVPTKPGTFSGQIYHGYAGSGGVTPMLLPFGLTVLAGLPSNTTSVVTGTGIHSGVVHEPGNILVELRDKYNNKVGNSSQQMELFPSFYASTSLVDVSFKFPSDSKPEGYSISTEYSSAKEAYSTEYLFSQTALVNLDITIMGNKLVLNNYIGTTINAGSISPSQTTVEGPGVGDAGPISAGNVVKFKILAKDEYGNRLLSGGSIFNVVIQSVVLASNGIDYIPDGKATTSPSNIVDNEDGTYETEYTLTLASYYHVEVRRGAVPIKGSPYLIQVLPGATDAASSIVYCEPDQLNCPLETLSVGKQGKFYIQAKDKYGGNKADFADQFFYSVVGGGFSKSSFAQFRDILYPGQYAGSFFTNTAGKVDITVRLMGNLVYQGSTIVVPGPANAFNSEIVSPLFPSSTVSSSSQSVAPKVFIVSKDAFGNKLTSGGLGDQLTLEFKVKNGDIIIPVDLTDEGDGTYSGLMTIKKADQYVAVAKLNGESLEKKDLHLLPAEIVPSNTLIYGQQEASAFTAGANCTILVQTFDEWFNVRYEGSDLSADKASIQISVASADTMVTYTGNSIKTEFSVSNGQYRITFVSELSGVARLKLTIGGTDVLDQTTQREWQQQVQSGDANPSKSTAYGAGTEKALSGTTSNFNVKVVDAFGNAATSQYLNEMNVEFALVGNGPTVAAVAAISKEIKWLGNSVYQVVYTPPSHSANYGLQVRVFLDEKVVVDGTNEIHKSFITVYSEAGEVSYPKTSITKESGEELVSFSSSSTSAGVPFSVYFQLADSNGVSVITSPSQDWLTVSVIPSVKSTAVVEVSPGFFRADILAEEIGDYKVSFFGDGTALGANDGISEPLYYLKVLPGWPSSALQSKHSFYQANLIAGIPFSFAITAYDLYGNAQGNQSVIYGSEKFGAAMYPLNGSISTDASCKATDNYDGTYGITCHTTIATTYRLSIYLDTATGERKEIGGTDSINVSVQPGQFSSSNSVVLAESLSIAAGNQFSAIIQGRDSFNNLHTSGGVIFDVSITEADSSPASMYDKKLVDRGDGKYQLTFALYQKGKYLLSILEEVTKLKVAETLSLDVTAASIDIGNSVISGSGLNGAIAGQTTTINVLLKDKYGNVADGQNEVQNMKFEIVGATSSDFADVSSVDESDNILLSYKIQFPADGLLSLSHNGLDVPSVGSVKIIPQKSPEIVSATFFDRYRKMSMVFDVSTDRGVSKVELDSNCGLYLKSESIALLGERPSCIWKDDKEITITLGYGATISPGDKLVVRDSIIMNSAQNSLYVSGFVAVKASSENPPTPSLSIVSSKSVGLCDDITLDVSSSSDQSGRPLTFTYTCESLHEDAYQVVEALKSLQNTNQTRVTLQSSLFVPGLDYKFGVVAKNFLGIAASSSVTVSKQAIPVPNIYVLGGSTKTIPKSHAITIEAYASFPDGSCLTGKSGESFGSMLENMEFIWSQTEGQAMNSAQSEAERNAHTSSLATRYFYLPSNILEAGSYKFQIRGNVKGSSQFASTAEVTLNVEASAINFNFVGGSRSVTVNQPLDISVDAVDPDDATGGATSAIPFEYSWDCKTATNTACPFTSTPVEYYQSSSKLPLSPKVGAFLPAGEYRFTATVSKEPLAANRIVTKSIDITVINTTVAAPVLSISGPKTAGKFNPSQQLTLEAVVEPSTYVESLTWSCSVGSLDLSKAALTTTTGSKYLVLKEDSLIGGQDYQFVATIPFGDLQLKAKFDMSVNAPPSSGLLRVTPSSGVEGLTVFEAAALNWVDNAEDQPLEYLFYSKDVSDSSAPEKLLSLAQDSGTLSFILPVGTYKIIAIISDSHGASTRIESESNIVVSKLSAGRRRLLQASSNSTMASDYIQNTILGFWNVGQISLTQMAIDIYLQNFITATNDKVPLSCNAVSSMSEPHGEILDLLLQIRNLKPFSAPLFEQQMCAYAGVSSDVEAVSANNVVKLYNQIANLQDSAVASNDFISSTSFLCMAEAISNAALVLEAQCENQPAQLRAEVFRLLDKMQQLTGKQLGPDATPMSLSTTSFTTTVKKFVLSDGQNSLGLNLGDFSDLQAEYSNFTAKFDSAGVTSSFATMALTQIRTPNWITNVKDRHRLVSDLHMIQFDFDFENVNDETLLGIRVEKNTNVQLHLQDKFPTTQLWQGNQWLPSLTNTSVSHTNSLDVLGNHSISGSSIFPSTYILHYKLLVFGAYMVDTPKPPPPPPPPPNPPPPNPPPPPPPPPIVKEDKEELDLLYIVLIAVGGFLVLCFFIGCCCCRKNSRKKRIISAADDDTDIEDEEIPEVERNSEYSQLQAVAGEREQYTSSHFNPFASNQVNLPSHHSTQQHKTLRDMLLANRN